jgi:hypothetical protein
MTNNSGAAASVPLSLQKPDAPSQKQFSGLNKLSFQGRHEFSPRCALHWRLRQNGTSFGAYRAFAHNGRNDFTQCAFDRMWRITQRTPRFFTRKRFEPHRNPHTLDCCCGWTVRQTTCHEFHRKCGYLCDHAGNSDGYSLTTTDRSQPSLPRH